MLHEAVDEPQQVEQVDIVDVVENSPASRSRARAIAGGALMLSAAGALVFEQTPANESMRFNIGFDTLLATHSELAVGLAIGGLTTVIEGAAAGLIIAGLHIEPAAIDKIEEGFNSIRQKLGLKKQDIKDVEDGGEAEDFHTESVSDNEPVEEEKKTGMVGEFMGDVAVSMTFGAAIVTYRRHRQNANPTVRKDVMTTIKATGIVATLSGVIAWGIAGGSKYTEGTIFEKPTEWLIDYGSESKYWLAALVGGLTAIQVNNRAIKPAKRWSELKMVMPIVSRYNDWKFGIKEKNKSLELNSAIPTSS